jgi:hypothetical protein
MTDITSKNNYYYSAFQYNSTSSAVQAQVDEPLLYPLLETSSDYQVALSKAAIDLSTIPLTRNNIPLKRYQVGLRNGATENTAFVRQLNGNVNNYVYNISKAGVITRTQYSSTGVLTPAGDGINVSQYFGTIGCFFVDDFQNYYVVGSPLANEQTWPLFMIFDLEANVLQSYTYPHIASATIDIAQRVYLGIDSVSGNQVLIFNNTNSDGAVSLAQIHTITSDKSGNPLGSIQTVCADQQIIVGTYTTALEPPVGRPTISIYNATTFACQTTYQLPSTFINFGSSSAISSLNDRFVVIDSGVLPDKFIGQSVGGTTVLNYDDNSTFVTGTFTANSNAIITGYPNATTAYTGYGINTNQLLNYSWNNTTGVTSTPTVIPQYTNWAPSTITNIGSGTAFNNLYAYSGDDNLYCLNASCVNDNQLYPMTVLAGAALPSDVLRSFSTSRHGGTFACGAAAGGFYALQHPVMPKNFLSFAQSTTSNSRYLSLQPAGTQFGTSNSSTFVPYSAQRNLYQYSPTATIYSMYEQIVSTAPYKHYLYQVIVDSPALGSTNYFLQQIDMSNMTLVQSINTGFNSTSVLDVQICHVPKPALDSPTASYIAEGFVCLVAGNGTGNIYFENNLGFVYKTFGFIVPEGGTNRVQVASCNDNSTVTFGGATATQSLIVIHADGSEANIQAFEFYAAPTFSNVVLLPWTIPITTESVCGLYGVNWGQTSSGGIETTTCQVVVATQDILNNVAVTAYTVAVGLQSQPSSVAYTGVPSGLFAFSQRGNKPFNQVQNLIYVPLPTAATQFEIFNTQTRTYVGTVNVTPNASPYTTSFTTVSTFANDLFGSWTQMTQTGGSRVLTNFYSTQVSNSLANTIYVIGDSNDLFEGVYSGNNIAFHLWNHNGELYTNRATVNTHPALVSSGQQTAYNFSVSSQTPEGTYFDSGDPIFSVARNEITSEFLLARGVGVQSAATQITSLPASNFTPANFDVAGSNAYLLWVKNGIDISAGNADIYNISTLIDAVNAAFIECAAKFPPATFQEVPYVSLDFTTGLVTLHYGTELSTLPYTKFAQMNPALLQLFVFPNAVDSVNPIMNNITPLPPTSTSYTQTSKSIYLFNELDKIVFISNTIFVFGSFFGNNNTNNIITDIDVPTNSAGYVDNVGQTLYYQPSFLRPFMLSSNNALQRIQLFINYVYRNGAQYPLLLAPNTNFSAKLIFPRRY